MIGKRQRRRKIFYVPGMISLILIPLFCFYHFYKVDAFKVYGGINLVLPYKDIFEESKVAEIRKYKVFYFNESVSEKKKLNEMKSFLRDLEAKKDTVNGIRIHFGPKGNYQTFIDIVDILAEKNTAAWLMKNNDIYILRINDTHEEVVNNTKSYRMNCGTADIIAQEQFSILENNRREEKRNFQMSFFKQKWMLLSLGYIGLVLLNILTLVKFNKNR